MLDWHFKTFDQLSNEQLYALLKLRQDIFIVEQDCPYSDADNRDQTALHLSGYQRDVLVAALRILPAAADAIASAPELCLGRLVVSASARGKGYGKAAIHQALDYIRQHTAASQVTLSGQCYLHRFYCELGFESEGDIYLEDGIEHQRFIIRL